MTKATSKISKRVDPVEYYFGGKPPTDVFHWNKNEKDHFIVGNQGGTSSSKTYSIVQVLMFKACEKPDLVITVVGQDVPNMKKGVIRDFKNIRKSSTFFDRIVINYHKTDRVVTFHNGSVMEFASYEDWQDAKAGKRDFLFINEANGIDWEIAEQLILRTKKRVYIDFNANRPFWYHEHLMGLENCITYYSNYLNNRYCPDNTKSQILLLRERNWNDWNIYGLGKTGKPTNQNPAWYGFREEKHVSEKASFDPSQNIHVSWDQNLRPYVSQLCSHIEQVDNDHYRLKIFDEIASKPPKNQIIENCNEFKRRYPKSALSAFLYYYGDASLHVGSTLAKRGVTGFSQISGAYKSYLNNNSNRTHRANPPVELRTEFFNILLGGREAGGLKLDVLINPKCEYLLDDLKYQKQGPTGKPLKERVKDVDGVTYEKYGHMADALIYLVTSAFARWWHNFQKNKH